MDLIKRRKLITSCVALALVVGASLAFAAWTTSGSGQGYAKAGSAEALSTLNAAASTTASLYPGSDGDVKLEISNPNSFPVRVTSVSLNGTNADISADAGHSGCTTTGVSFTNRSGLTIDVPAGGTQTATLTGAASMSNASLNACQGATFTIPVTLSGSSNAS